jgi:hypothetical protein
MLSPALSATVGAWLILCPYMGLETGPRAILATAVGWAAVLLSPLGIWRPGARWAVAAMGTALGLFTLAVPPSTLGSLINWTTSGVLLALAGMIPTPVVVAAAMRPAAAAPSVEMDETGAGETLRLRPAA